MRAKIALALIVAALSTVGCRRGEHPRATEPVDAFFAKQGLTRAQAWGRHVFEIRCAVCHGATGRGDGKNAYTLDPPPPDFAVVLRAHPPTYWRQVISDGTASVGRSPLCPSWRRTLSADDIDGLIAHLEFLARQPESRERTRHRRPTS